MHCEESLLMVLSTCCGSQVAFELFAMHWCAHSRSPNTPAGTSFCGTRMLAML